MTFQSFLGPTALERAERSSSPLRRAGGPYGWLTPYLAALAARNPSIAARILSLPRDELHFIAMALALMGEARDAPESADALAAAIGRDRRESILGALAMGFDPKLARLCGKLAGRPWRAPTYRQLAALWAEPHARKVLAHLPAITRRAVRTLTRLPAPYRKAGVLKMVGRPTDLARVLFAIEIVRRVRTDLTDRQIVASLARADGRYIRDWVEAHYDRLPFPKAPTGVLTDGRGAVLRPVSTGGELKRTALDFDNCLSGRLWDALNGNAAVYRFEIDGKPVACVELKPAPGLGWAINELNGRNNDELHGADRLRIIDLFAASGVVAAPQARSRFSWFDLA